MNAPKLRFMDDIHSWSFLKLKDLIIELYQGLNTTSDLKYTKRGIPFLQAKHITHGIISYEDVRFLDVDLYVNVKDKYNPKKNDILFTNRGTIGKSLFIDTATDFMIAWNIMLIKVDSGTINPYLLYLKLSDMGERGYFDSMQTGNATKFIKKDTLLDLKIGIPTDLKLQNKISDFFQMINKKIQLQLEKIDLLKVQKKGLMQKIYNQKLRFKDENGQDYPDWNQVTISDILELNIRPVPKPDKPYIRLGLRSHAKGTFHELVAKPEEVQMDTLYVVKENDLIVNITFAWEQAIAIADVADEGKLVSHRFPTYTFKESHYSVFYNHFFTTRYMKHCLTNASPGGAGRNRVLNKKAFLGISLSVPNFKEQVKIGNFIHKLDSKISVEEKKLTQFTDQKKSLMQQMFI